MFKKLIIATSIFAISTSSFAFGGAYVGADLGGNYAMFKDEGTGTDSIKFGGLGGLVDVVAGYGTMASDRVYLGAEVFASGYSSTVEGYKEDALQASLDFDTNYSYGASIIPGILLNDKTMAYGRLGVVRTGFKVKYSALGNSTSDNEIATGGQAGLGLQTSINKNLDVRGEYDFTSYRSFDALEDNKISPTSGQIKLGLIYRFN